MQQAIYNNISNLGRAAKTSATASQAAGVLRWVARRWDLVGALAQMGSSTAYGVFALTRLGL